MQELDPTTNLPKDSRSRIDPPTDKKRDSLARINTAQPVPVVTPQKVQGTHGDYGDINVTSDRNFNEIRAQQQTGFQLSRNATAQALGVVVGGTIERLGFLGDISEGLQMLAGSEVEFERNFVSQIGKDIMDWSRDKAPVHTTEQAQSGTMSRFMDGTYWASHFPSIASSLTDILPGFAVAKGLGGLGRAFNMGKRSTQTTQTLGAALQARHGYNLMEAHDVFERQYEESIQRGLNATEASKQAGEAASHMYRYGYLNMWKDVAAWSILLKGTNYASRNVVNSITKPLQNATESSAQAIRKSLLRNPNVSPRTAMQKEGFSWVDYLKQAGLEGAEEFNIQFQKRLAMKNTDIANGFVDGEHRGFFDAYFGAEMGEHLVDPETWDASLFGFLGGAAFQGAGTLIGNMGQQNRAEQEAASLKREQSKIDHMQKTLQDIDRMLSEGDQPGANMARSNLILQLALNGLQTKDGGFRGAAEDGTLGNTIEMLDAVELMNAEELSQLGLSEQAKENAVEMKQEMEKIAEIYNKHMDKNHGTEIDNILAAYMTEQEYLNEQFESGAEAMEASVQQRLAKIHSVLNSDQIAYVDSRLKKESLEKAIQILESENFREFGADPYRARVLTEIRDKTVADLKEQLETETETFKQVAKDTENTKETSEYYQTLVQGEDESSKLLNRHSIFKEVQKARAKEGKLIYQKLQDPEMHKQLEEYFKTNKEKFSQEITRYLLEKQVPQDSYVRREEEDGSMKTYRVDYGKDDSITLNPIDGDLNPIRGEDSISISNLQEAGDLFIVDSDNLLTEEQYDEIKSDIKDALKSENFDDAIDILTDQLWKSNWRDEAKGIRGHIVRAIARKIDNIRDLGALHDLHNTISQRIHNDKTYERFRDIISERQEKLFREREAEIEAIEKTIRDKEKGLETVAKDIAKIDKDYDSLQNEIDLYLESLNKTLEKQGRVKLDGRTKIAKEFEALEQKLLNAEQNLKDQQAYAWAQMEQISKDIDTLSKLKEEIKGNQLPEQLTMPRLESLRNEFEAGKAELLHRQNITDERLQLMYDQLKHLHNDFAKGIEAVNKLHEEVSNVNNASNMLFSASQKAIDELFKTDLLSEDQSLFVPISEELVRRYKSLFNKHLTQEISAFHSRTSKEGVWGKRQGRIIRYVQRQRDYINNLDPDTMGWAEMNIDFPVYDNIIVGTSTLGSIRREMQAAYNAIQQRIHNPTKALNGKVETLSRKIELYETLHKNYRDAIRRERAAVKPSYVKPRKKGDPVATGADAPMRTVSTYYTRFAGDSGTNKNPSETPSQRRYGRFVNSFNPTHPDTPMIAQISRAKDLEDLDIYDGLDNTLYKKEDILVAVIQDKEGNFYQEDGTTTKKFNKDKSIFTTVPLVDSSIPMAPPTPALIRDKFDNSKIKYDAEVEKQKRLYEAWRNNVEEQLDSNQPVHVEIRGKGTGVIQKGEKPISIKEVFNNLEDLEFGVATKGYIELQNGDLLSGHHGYTYVYNNTDGNHYEIQRRGLNNTEVETIVKMFKLHAVQSKIDELGRVNYSKDKTERQDLIKQANMLRNEDNEPLDMSIVEGIKLYMNAFYEGRSPLEFTQDSKVPGGQVTLTSEESIEKYDIFATDPDTENKINVLNPAFEKALEQLLKQQSLHIRSDLLHKDEEFYIPVLNKEGTAFAMNEYETYFNFLLEQDNLNVNVEQKPKLTLKDGTTEEGYKFANQNLAFDNRVPTEVRENISREIAEEYNLKSKKTEKSPFTGKPIEKVASKNPFSTSPEEASGVPEKSPFEQAPHPAEQEKSTGKKSLDVGDLDNKSRRGRKSSKSSRTLDTESQIQPDQVSSKNPFLQREVEYTREAAHNLLQLLSDKTGVSYQVIGKDQAKVMLDAMYDRGHLTERIPKDELPLGLYHTPEGVYIITDDTINMETAFHEFAHPVIEEIITDNPFLFDNLKEEIRSTKEGQRVINFVLKHNKGLVDPDTGNMTTRGWAEVVTTAIGRLATDQTIQRSEPSLWNTIKNLWSEVVGYINRVFGLETDPKNLNINTTLSEVAELLSRPEVKLKIDELSISRPLFQNAQTPHNITQSFNSLPGKNSKFTADTMDYMNSHFMRYLFVKHPQKVSSLFDGSDNSSLYNDIMDSVFEHTKERIKDYKEKFEKFSPADQAKYESLLQEKVNNHNYLLDNFDVAEVMFSKYLSQFNLEVINDDTMKGEGLTDDANRLWAESSIKYSTKQNATSDIRLLIGSLQGRKFNSTFDTYQTIDFGKVFNIVANHLADTTTLEEKKAKLNKISNLDGIQDLISRLFREQDPKNFKAGEAVTLLKFNQVFSKNNSQYDLIMMGDDNYHHVIDANVNTARKRTIQRWRSNMNLQSSKYKLDGDQVIINTEHPDIAKYKNSNIYEQQTLTDSQAKQIESLPISDKKKGEKYFKAVNALKDVGINITALQQNNDNIASQDLPDPAFWSKVDWLIKSVAEENIKNIFHEAVYSENLRIILDHELEHSIDAIENQHLNLENETVYNLNLNSYLSTVQKAFNDSNNLTELAEKAPHLFSTDYNKNSLILNISGRGNRAYNQLFDAEGNKITDSNKNNKNLDVAYAEGVSNDNTGENAVFKDMKMNDKIHMLLNSSLIGNHPMFRAGDNSLERYIKGFEFYTKDQIKKAKYVDAMLGYLVDEIRLATELSKSHKEGNQYANESGYVNNFFENSIIGKIIEGNTILKNAVTESLESGAVSNLFDNSLRNRFNYEIESFVEQQVQDTQDYLIENYIIEREGGRFKNNALLGLSKEHAEYFTDGQVKDVIRQALVNRALFNVEQTKILMGNPLYYGSPDNLFKRMSAAVSTKKISSTGHIENQILNEHFPSDQRLYSVASPQLDISTTSKYTKGARPVLRTAVSSDVEVKSIYLSTLKKHIADISEYEGMNEADAFGLVSLDTFRDMKLRSDNWTEAQERLYQWQTRPKGSDIAKHTNWTTGEVEEITSGNITNPDGSRTVFTMLKPQSFGPLAENGFKPGMYKLAVMPLLREYDNEAMNTVRNFMNDKKVGLLTFESANKVGTKLDSDGNLNNIYNEEGKVQLDNISIQDTYYDYWGLQLETGDKIKYSGTKASQITKQLMSNAFQQGKAINKDMGSKVQRLQDANKALIEKGKEELKEELQLKQNEDGSYTAKSVDKLADFLKEQSAKRDASNNVLDSFELYKKFHSFNLGLDVISNRDKVENILASIADSRVISTKLPGGAKVQAPSTMLEGYLKELPDGKREYKDGELQSLSEQLKFYEEDSNGNIYMEVALPHQFKQIFGDMNVTDLEGQAKLLEGLGFRIPTSGMNSIEKIKIVKFLPQSAGDVIVLPSEIVAKAGSDYDVDKLNLFLPNYQMVDGKPTYIQFFKNTNSENNLKKIYEERYGRIIKAKNAIQKKLEEIGSKETEGETQPLRPDEVDQALGDSLSTLFDMFADYDNTQELVEYLRTETGQLKLADKIEGMPTEAQFIKNNKGVDPYIVNSIQAVQNEFITAGMDLVNTAENRSDLFTSIGTDILQRLRDEVNDLRGINREVSFADVVFNFKYYVEVTQRNIDSKLGTGIGALHTSDHVFGQIHDYQLPSEYKLNLPHNQSENGNVSLGGQTTVGGKHKISNLLNQLTNMFVDGAKDPIGFDLNISLDTANTVALLMRAGVPIETLGMFLNQPIIRDYVKLRSISRSQMNNLGQEPILTIDKINTIISDRYGSRFMEMNFSDPSNTDMLRNQIKSPTPAIQRQLLKEFLTYETASQDLSNYIEASRLDTQAMGKNTAELDLKLHHINEVLKGELIVNADKLFKEGFMAPHYQAISDMKEMFRDFFTHYKDNSKIEPYYDAMIKYITDPVKYIPKNEQIRILDNFKSDYLTYTVLRNTVMINGVLQQPIAGQLDLVIGDNTVAKRLLRETDNGLDNSFTNNLHPIIGTTRYKGQLIDTVKLFDQKLDPMELNQMADGWRELFNTHPQLATDLTKLTLLQSGLQMSPMTFTKVIPAEKYMEIMTSGLLQRGSNSIKLFIEEFFENNYNNNYLIPIKKKNMPKGYAVAKSYVSKEKSAIKRAEMKAKGINPYEAIPTFEVNHKQSSFDDISIFTGQSKFKPRGIKDFRNSVSVLSYGRREAYGEVTPEKKIEPLSEEQQAEIIEEFNRSNEEKINQILRCQ